MESIISLLDWFRARGLELVSPDDVLEACKTFKVIVKFLKLRLRVKIRRFPTPSEKFIFLDYFV